LSGWLECLFEAYQGRRKGKHETLLVAQPGARRRRVDQLIIGILIFAWPDSSATTLVNFMGIYWLVSGLMSLRWGFATRKAKGLWFAAGLIGMIGGMAILLRPFYTSYFPPGLPLTLFGIIALVTGLVHIIGGFRTETLSRVHTWGSVLLGVLEVALGCCCSRRHR
jgi:uncharacterized membrane protein HdeD (DUF308 family)